jgi:predicted nucleic acid-binding protein
VIAYVLDEPAAASVGELLRGAESRPRISAANIAEVVDVLIRVYERSPAAVMDTLVLLEAGGLRIVEVDAAIGRVAGHLHARHYDRRTRPLSLADCVALATAAELDDALATSDPPLAEAARTEQLSVIGLPDSQGRRP